MDLTVTLTSSPESNGSAIGARTVNSELSKTYGVFDGAFRVALASALVNADLQPYLHFNADNFGIHS